MFAVPRASKPKWWNWWTRWLQEPVGASPWGFESPLRHATRAAARQWRPPISIPWQRRVDVHRPRVDPAAQAPHFREARRLQDLERFERARAMVAVGHHLTVAVQLAQAVGQLPQRNQHGPVDVGDFVLVRLAHVDDEKVGVPIPFGLELRRRDLRAFVRRLGADAAERLVIDQLSHAGPRATHRTVGILRQLQLPVLKLQRVEQQQAAYERL